MTPQEKRIAELKEAAKKAIEKAKKKQAEAIAVERRINNLNAAKRRKEETRKKILIGSMHLARAEKFPDHKERTLKELDKFLTTDADRLLFGLEPLPKPATKAEEDSKTKDSEKEPKKTEGKGN